MSFVQMVCTNGYQSASKPRVPKWVCYKLVSKPSFDIEPRWASGAVFGPQMQWEIGSGGPISDIGLFRSVK